ncbi:DUF742 domain-containing protein [Streptomyces sp. NBC_01571]|uniref:DUF742 domain-containing protein n=1 Tax=Streptomyces sp. NBC_01571 TaxID=2975883 RepID=UPI0022585AE0|nr:DUF742 domain-containing protein [Streptomyces sp. NBC_01571]MCX4578876.1 DUF742 domain-containing protein [Streptomyces sp. NBC_01571]
MPTPEHAPHVSGGGPPRLRPYTVNEGRTLPRLDLERTTLVKACRTAPHPPQGAPERSDAFALCRRDKLTITEIAGRMRLPVQAVKVLVADLITEKFLMAIPAQQADAKDPDTLRRVLAGLEAL